MNDRNEGQKIVACEVRIEGHDRDIGKIHKDIEKKQKELLEYIDANNERIRKEIQTESYLQKEHGVSLSKRVDKIELGDKGYKEKTNTRLENCENFILKGKGGYKAIIILASIIGGLVTFTLGIVKLFKIGE